MAGEWIPYDVCLPQKPEVVQLVDATGLEVATVCGRLQMFWGWASLNSSDGTARISVRLLARICGGDEAFWLEVAKVGWLEIDAEGGTVAIPGWERRFSKSAKSRALAAIRHDADKIAAPERPRPGRAAPPTRARGAPEEIEEIRGDRSSSSSPGDAAHGEKPADWDDLRKAWANGSGRPWKLTTAPDKASDRLGEPGWFQKAVAAIEALPRCKYFRDPVTLAQLVAPGFVDKVLGGQFDNPREQRQAAGYPRVDERPPAEGWKGDDAARFEATKRRMVEQLRAEGAA
jgi:hypothetical protein